MLAFILIAALVVGSCKIEHRGSAEAAESDTAEANPASIAATSEADDVSGPDPNDPRSLEQHLKDASLAAQVKLALADDHRLRLLNLEPDVRQGVVVLHGELPSAEHAALATQIARGVPGVRAVRDTFEVAQSEAGRVIAADTALLDTAPTKSPAPTNAQQAAAPTETDAEFHTVASGESLWEIARENGTTVEALKRLNDMQGDRLRPGQRLRIR